MDSDQSAGQSRQPVAAKLKSSDVTTGYPIKWVTTPGPAMTRFDAYNALATEVAFHLSDVESLSPAPKWTFPADRIVWIPIEIATGDTLIVDVILNGCPTKAILDSGCAVSIVSTSLALKLNIRSSRQASLLGSSGIASTRMSGEVEILFAGELRRVSGLAIADISTVSSAFGRGIDMVLGLDAFADRCVALDFSNRSIAVLPSSYEPVDADWTIVPLARGTNKELLVYASVNDRRAIPLVFDLGCSAALLLSAAYVDEHLSIGNGLSSTALIGGVEGAQIVRTFTSTSVCFGESCAVVSVPSASAREWMSSSAEGNVGLPLIAKFDVVIDVTGLRLWLRPAKCRDQLPMLKNRSGLGLAAGPTALTIVHVAANSPAQAAGLTVGISIVAINGNCVDTSYTRGSLWGWRFRPAGTVVTLETSTGVVFTIRLLDYY